MASGRRIFLVNECLPVTCDCLDLAALGRPISGSRPGAVHARRAGKQVGCLHVAGKGEPADFGWGGSGKFLKKFRRIDDPGCRRGSSQACGVHMTTTSGSAKWQGGIKDGKGAISTKSGALKDYPYGFASRFEGKPGSNPEELIGAAHAACFTMALSLILGEAKLTAEQMETKADVTLEKVGEGFAITSVHLSLSAKIPGADNAKFQELAGMAKAGCPVSKLLNTKISLDAKLV
jgi:lipoyl-dependent peroxiredoxin